MELLTLSTGLLLPWLGGALWLVAFESWIGRGARPSRARQAGYGFFLGYAVLCLAVLACDALTGQVIWAWIMLFLLLLAACGGLTLWLAPVGHPAYTPEPLADLGAAQKTLMVILAAWIGLHLLFAAIEVLSQPVYPWDAWQTWVYRAKAWFLAGKMAEVVSPEQWLVATVPHIYTATGADYPALPSVIPYWAALSLGRWSETLVNLPALLAGGAIGLALYGQCRESGMNILTSVIACYLLFSIPLFGTHIALAGYADLWMAGFAGLGFLALVRGAAEGLHSQTILGLLMVALAMLIKNEGVVWFLAALLMLALITLRLRSILLAGLAIAALVLLAYLLDITHVEVPLLGGIGVINGRLEIPLIGSFALEVHNVWQVYWVNFFAMGSWNLLWLLVAAGLLIAVLSRRSIPAPLRRAGAIFIVMFLAAQLFIFGFTDQGIWADKYTAINRLPLHFIPALIYTAVAIVRARILQADSRSVDQEAQLA